MAIVVVQNCHYKERTQSTLMRDLLPSYQKSTLEMLILRAILKIDPSPSQCKPCTLMKIMTILEDL